MRTVLSILIVALSATTMAAETNRVTVAVVTPIAAAAQPLAEVAQVVAVTSRTDVVESVRVANRATPPAWYDYRLYDGETALGALATRARWHAAQGDEEEVAGLYAYWLWMMREVELEKEEP